jgi:replicative DNA helicase
MSESAFTFPGEFQRDILRLLLSDRAALATLRPALVPDYFTDETYRWVASAAFKVFDEANAHPGQPSVLQAAIDECPGSLDPEEVESAVRALYEDGLPEDAEYVRGRVTEFARAQRLRAAAAEAEEMLESGQYDEWIAKVNAAGVVGAANPGDDMDLQADARETILTLDAVYGGAVPTTVTALDERLDGHGLCPGEMGVVLGWPGYHKTTLLVNIGVGAMSVGKRVAHFAFEGGRRKVATRYYCAITKTPKSEFLMNRERALEEVEGWFADHGGSLRLSYFPKETCTLAMLEAKLKRWEAFGGWRPDLLIVDYPKLMKPTEKADFRLQVSSLYTGVQALAGRWEIPTWVAQQSDRPGGEKMKAGGVLSMMNAAETFEPCRDADVIISTNQTDEEKQDGILRLHGAKMREAESGWTVSVRVDPERSLILPIVTDLSEERPLALTRRREKPPEPDDD